MTGRPRTATDAAIFAAVNDVVNESGPTAVTLAAVADRVGITAPALTNRFGSKRGLLLEFSRQGANAVEVAFDGPHQAATSSAESITTALLWLSSYMHTQRQLANNLAFLQLDLTDDDLRVHAVAHSRKLRRRMARAIVQANADGELEVDDPKELAELLYAVYNGALVSWAIDGKGALSTWLRVRIEQTLRSYRPARVA